MFNSSLKEAVDEKRKANDVQESEEMDTAPQSELQKKLLEEEREKYQIWLNDPITQKVFQSFEKEILSNNDRLLKHCLGTGIDRPVEDRRVLYWSLKNKVINELLKVLKKG